MPDIPDPAPASADFGNGTACLRQLPRARLLWLGPWPGSGVAMSDAFRNTFGTGLPQVGQVLDLPKGRCLWAGREAAILQDADKPAGLENHGAVVDVSDGWVRFGLSGAGRAEVMARVCPVDLRASALSGPTALRSPVGHVSALIISGQPEIEVWVMRSFARSVEEDLKHAISTVNARQSLRV
ncbi:sarcosine oxidase subunit gamma [Tropicimonas sp. S265A]|uniref:sarcosine oxidase subunit gamma n=1 Tax=Tropicimonas sp. S265A TaxID=3415134 RepID=UPI003C7B3950